MTAKNRAIVIGSGFGGLAAAARLGARGYRVMVLEKLDAPGGRAYVYRQDGFTFDAGPTIITAPYLFTDLWKFCGRNISDDVTLKAIDPFYEVRFDDGDVFRYTSDLESMRKQIARIEPRDVDGFNRFLGVSKKIFEVAFKGQAEQPFHAVATLLRAAPDLVRLGGYRSVFQEVSRYFHSDKLRVLFSFHPLLIGGNPFTTTAYYCLIAHLERTYGVHYAEGGMGALMRGIVKLVETHG
ncbi:MAG: phytoene desaturase, partial [Gammaproteobacteria bacterium]|nr:phytoene desaturase [Gammaproteobacteria bacterium]